MDDETRIRFVIVPKKMQKGIRNSQQKVYVLAIADSIETDNNSLLQCFSLMQDDPKARVNNRVPIPRREILTKDETYDKVYKNFFKDEVTYYGQHFKKLNSGWSPGHDKPNFKQEYYISEEINLQNLQQRAKVDRVTVNDIFGAACLNAYYNTKVKPSLRIHPMEDIKE